MLQRIKNPAHEVTIAVVGKYIKHHDAYKSVYEALDHAGIALTQPGRRPQGRGGGGRARGGRARAGRRGRHPRAGRLRQPRHRRQDRGDPLRPRAQGAVLRHLPGPAVRGDRVRPQRRRPGGRQHAPSSTATAATRSSACSTSSTRSPTWAARCGWGSYPCTLAEGSQAHQAYGGRSVHERHRHRYEFNNQLPRSSSRRTAWSFSGTSPDGKLVEVIELPRPPVVRGGAVPPGVQVEADAGAPAVPRLRPGEPGAARWPIPARLCRPARQRRAARRHVVCVNRKNPHTASKRRPCYPARPGTLETRVRLRVSCCQPALAAIASILAAFSTWVGPTQDVMFVLRLPP